MKPLGLRSIPLTHTFRGDIGGRELTIETGKLAQQADAAVTVRYGDTVVLVTMCFNRVAREGVDFLPLTIDYEERLYAAGKIPGGFIRREGRPSEAAILACRQTDRPIRPLLPKTWHSEIQIVTTVLSADQENDPDILSVIGASACLAMSDVPFDGPVGAVNVGYINGELVLNPKMAQFDESLLDLVVVSTRDKVIMVEAGAKEISEDIVLQAVKFAHEANQEIIRLQEQLQQEGGRPKLPVPEKTADKAAVAELTRIVDEKLAGALQQGDKGVREQMMAALVAELTGTVGEAYAEKDIAAAIDERIRAEVRSGILEKGQRIGGRGLTEIRPITCEVGLLPRTHGSGMFTRGQTQVLTITTLGSSRKEQMLDGLGLEESKRFIHHYNFPGFSTGEVRRIGSPGRREIGHGALAERALVPVLPTVEDFPYTIRLVSEVLSSSGSTSMASVCAGSLSLMDAGIPVKKAVAGVAMGLVTGEDGKYAVLTDIEGLEDFNGDMDFKVAGTRDGITAIQMDTKLQGISLEIVEKTLHQARDGRMFILDKMNAAISASRPDVSRFAPRMTKIKIDPGKIGAVIGTGGKTIRSIIEETKTTIDVSDDGTVVIGSPDMEATQKAIAIIEGLTREVEVGDVYTGKVSRILDFGAMVEVLPGKEGLVHISELADYRVGKVEDIVKVGDEVMVKVISIDNLGRVNLSRKALFEKENPEAGNAREDTRPPRYPDRRSGPGGSSGFGNRPRYSGDRPNRPRQGPSRPPFKRS
ncbi:MAG: polyribonucleotide nucleotidyltransferase [Chloroflexi bacterium RBG_16_56_11]|nr:MAG: polyribonucleotide nucleotidyltransferase [Chloroflexi bacterium RBG_16_56_11]